MEKEKRAHHAHVLLVPHPRQGHINPLLQFSKRLLSKGRIRVTLAVTVSLVKTMEVQTGPISVETFSDGYDNGRRKEDSPVEYFERFKMVGSQTLTELIKKQESLGDPINCVVYDSFLPWVLDVAKQFNLIGASFFTQSCAVYNIYYHVQQGILTVPVAGRPVISLSGLPSLAVTDLPSFVSEYELRPELLPIVLGQFSNIDKTDWLLINSFDKLEQEVVNWMAKLWPVKTIGPTVPSFYLDERVEGDKAYGLNLFKPVADACMNWLNMRETGSVVYVSYGSIAELGDEQMKELALSLKESNNHFLWVVRQSEEKKLPTNFVEETLEKGVLCPVLLVYIKPVIKLECGLT
ncbi:hypothetical protein NE237_031486 [Protea cynaroides]|uniref:Uncharacterized protein n=1 Tax=Protea cynaroides TaxID=273540 RepID=A0A9Q0L2C0_9MAGN|nr:hypothetical protein NE237_031486 [Protea cynaroides]